MADEEVKPNEEVAQATPETVAEVPAEDKQEELPLAAESAEPEVKPEEPPKEEPKPDWRERELKAKHRQLQEAKRREADLIRERDDARALAAKFNQGKEALPEVVPADEVEKRAQQIVTQQRYVEDCNKAAQTGEKQYGTSWKEAIENLEVLGGFDQDTMNGVLASDDPAKVLYELGKNPDRYRQVMEMPLPKRIIEMGKLAMQPTQVKKVSDAPAPVNPVGGRAAPPATVLHDEMDDDKWFQTRRAQRRAKWEQNNVRR
jgi:hypothetical protein